MAKATKKSEPFTVRCEPPLAQRIQSVADLLGWSDAHVIHELTKVGIGELEKRAKAAQVAFAGRKR